MYARIIQRKVLIIFLKSALGRKILINVHAIGENYCKNQLNDVAYVRLYLPLQLLADEKHIKLTTGFTYKGHEDSDIFIVRRTGFCDSDPNSAELLIRMIRSRNKKLIYEIDDNLLDNPGISSFNKMVIRYFAKSADTIIVSTPNLKRRMECFNNNIKIIPNYLDARLINTRRRLFEKNKTITIGYMGTFTHQRDFQMIKFSLLRVLQKFRSKVSFEIIGAIDDIASIRSFPNTKIRERSEIKDYFTFWRWMNENCFWDIGIAPLKYNEFTCCKSDIKYLDYSALGIAGVYSCEPSYANTIKHRVTGLLVENNSESWQSALEELICDESLRNTIRVSSHNDLWKNRILQDNKGRWLEIIKETIEENKYCPVL